MSMSELDHAKIEDVLVVMVWIATESKLLYPVSPPLGEESVAMISPTKKQSVGRKRAAKTPQSYKTDLETVKI